jgi:molybdate transport system substrate-binding protein
MKTGLITATAFALLCTDTPASPAAAAEIRLFASNAINAILAELVPRFEAARGHKVTMRLDYAALLRKQIEAGASFDVAILVGDFEDLVKQGRIAAGTPVALGRTGYGLAVRAGAPKPDIGTTEAFKRTLLNARSVAYSRDGGSGAYFVQLLDRLGIADAMKPKLRPGSNTQHAVASGGVEMTVNGIVPILRARGIELVGPLPAELQSYSTFVAGIGATTTEKDAATALLRYLRAPDAIAVLQRRGVEPVPTE